MSSFRREYRAEVDRIGRESYWTVGRVTRWGVFPILILSSIGWGVHLLTAPARAVSGVVDRTLNSDNILANYEWFKQTWQDVQAMTIQTGNAQSSLDGFKRDNPRPWDYPISTEYARLNAIVLGLQNQRQNLVAQYNARSQMMNRSLFKTHDLPEILQ